MTLKRSPDRRPALRYLTRVGEHEPFAYASNRRDFHVLSDHTIWAHESHDWLLAARSGAALAHRTGDCYYDVDTGEPLFTQSPGLVPGNNDIDLRDRKLA